MAALLIPRPASAYSVLSHEAIIDSAWSDSIRPVLLARFPRATPDDLRTAHAFAYAGCILQDMGYYPFGSKFFSDLVHYVRSGDFIINLLQESQDLNEYAFALGAMAHYAADTQGHSIAVNPAVAIEFPKLRRRYGDSVTYAEKPVAHLRVEFGFDVMQVARNHYAPQAYHDFIGFKVARPLLERAFRKTYSLEITDVFGDLDLALNTYRKAVSVVIPIATRAAWESHKEELQKAQPGLTRRQFQYNISKASYRKEWGTDYKQPSFAVRTIGFLIRILPKIGPLKLLKFRTPSAQTDLMFQRSFDQTLTLYRRLLHDYANSTLVLENRDFDTGALTRPAEYSLADVAYAELVEKLAEKDSPGVDPQVLANVTEYYHDLNLPFATKKNKSKWKRTVAALDKLKGHATPSQASR